LPALLALRTDVVVALSTPPLLAAMALLPQLFQSARLVYWAMDVYPDLLVALGALREDSVPARLLGAVAELIARRADTIVALDDAMRARLVAAGAAQEKIAVIDNWVDGDAIRPLHGEPNALRRELGLDGRFTVSYSGNMGLGHDFDTLVDAMQLLERDEVSWLFIGNGPKRRSLEAEVRRRNLRRVRFLDYRRADELPLSMTAADASIVTVQENVAGLVAPSKLYAILAAGLPVVYIGPAQGRSAELVKEGVGVAANNRDAATLAAGVRTLMREPTLRRDMGARARRVFDERFSRGAALARHCALIEGTAGAC
jgi:glycosyltransferase involved in cell wall biosynthesis